MDNPPVISIEPLIPKEELARRLGVSTSAVIKWQRQRRIPSYRFGRRCRRFDFPEVLKVLATYKTPAYQRFKRRRPIMVFPPTVRQVQTELPFRDPRQLLLFPDMASGKGNETVTSTPQT
jgi:excisionase family DNA binding protein